MNSSHNIYFTKDEWGYLVNQITETVIKHWRYDKKVSFTDEMRNVMDQIFNYYVQRIGEFDSIQSLSRSIIQDINYNIRNIVKQMREKPNLDTSSITSSNVTREHIKDEERKTFNDEFERRKRDFASVNRPENPLVPKPSLEPFDNFGATDINELSNMKNHQDTREDDTPLEKRIEDIMREREKDVIKKPTENQVTGLTLQEKNEIHHVIRNKLNTPMSVPEKKVSFSSNKVDSPIVTSKDNKEQLQTNTKSKPELINERNVPNLINCTFCDKTTFSAVDFKPTDYGRNIRIELLLPNVKYTLKKCDNDAFIDMMICSKTNRKFTSSITISDIVEEKIVSLDSVKTCVLQIGSYVKEMYLSKVDDSYRIGNIYIQNRGTLDFNLYTNDGYCITPPKSVYSISNTNDKLTLETNEELNIDIDTIKTFVSSNQDILYTYNYNRISNTKFVISHKFQTTQSKISTNIDYWDINDMPLMTIQ